MSGLMQNKIFCLEILFKAEKLNFLLYKIPK